MRPRVSRFVLCALAISLGAIGCPRGKTDDGAASAAPVTTAPAPATPTTPDVAFAGNYNKTASVTMKAGRRVPNASNSGKSTLTIGGGKAVWSQTYTTRGAVQSITQVYTYAASDAKAVANGFDMALTWQSITGDTAHYSPDKNKPNIQARKQADGWQIGLLTTDNNGVTGGAEFK